MRKELMNIKNELSRNIDRKYAIFQSRLIPTINKQRILGVRVPILRKIAKKNLQGIVKSEFLVELPHQYYEEDMLHGIVLSELKDFDLCIEKIDAFLPYVDNWAVCDIMSPKIFTRNKQKLLEKIDVWIECGYTYTVRFAIGMLMLHFLDQDFKDEYLKKVAKIEINEYYVKMMQSWYFATALVKQWEKSIEYLEQRRLERWVHNKTIQKAIESFRITDKQKQYLKRLKIK